MVLDEAAPPRAGIRPSGGVESVSSLAVIGKRVPQHEGVRAGQLMIDLGGGFRFRPCSRKVTVVDPVRGHAREGSACENGIDRRRHSGAYVGILERTVVFLLERRVVERAVFDDRTTLGRTSAIPVQVGRGVLRFKWIARVQCAVLQEDERIAMDLVRGATGYH